MQDIEYKKRTNLSNRRITKSMWEGDRERRLGIESKNNRRNHIRIAPMRGTKMPPNFLAGRINEVEKWIRNTLGCVKSAKMPKAFKVSARKEHPQVGDPFDVLWVNFEFNDEMWDDEVMWDIRYLLMGSKLDKLPGFPLGLFEIGRASCRERV